jgi:hypothetical protein
MSNANALSNTNASSAIFICKWTVYVINFAANDYRKLHCTDIFRERVTGNAWSTNHFADNNPCHLTKPSGPNLSGLTPQSRGDGCAIGLGTKLFRARWFAYHTFAKFTKHILQCNYWLQALTTLTIHSHLNDAFAFDNAFALILIMLTVHSLLRTVCINFDNVLAW